MAPKSQPKKIPQNQQQDVAVPSVVTKKMTDYSAFDRCELGVSIPYKTKYNAQAKIKYDGDDLLLRTPFLKRCFLNKFDNGPAQLTLSLNYEPRGLPTDASSGMQSDTEYASAGPFHDALAGVQSAVLNKLTEVLMKHPLDKKRQHEDHEDACALLEDLEKRMRPLIVNDNPQYPDKLRSEIAVERPDSKKLTDAVNCKIFLTEMDGKSKPISLRDMADLLDDRQFFYQVRAVLHFTHVYMGNSKGKQEIGIKHNVKAIQLKRVELGDEQEKESLAIDDVDVLS